MSYADLATFKTYLRIPPGDVVDDTELQRALDTATSEITHMCSRDFTPAGGVASVRYFQPFYDRATGRWVLPIDDLMTTTGLVVNTWNTTALTWSSPVTITDTDLRPLGAPSSTPAKPWTEILLPAGVAYTPGSSWAGWQSDSNADYVAVTARWGWTAVPAAVAEACLIQASRTFKRRDAPFGVTSTPDGSENTRLTNTVDVEVQVALRGYVKYWAAR